MERPRDPFELVIGLREDVTQLQTTVGHVQANIADLKQDIRRLDDRMFQLMLMQLGTMAASLGAIVAAVLR